MEFEYFIKKYEKLASSALSKDPKDRTYEDRFNIWKYEGFKNYEFYDEGEEVEIYDGMALANNEIKHGFGEDFPEWFRECGKHFGKKVKVSGEVGTLIGMSYTYMDYYYILENDGKKSYHTCVDKMEVL